MIGVILEIGKETLAGAVLTTITINSLEKDKTKII
jgi:hypothetical protein